MQQSTQRNYENGSSMTQMEVIEWSFFSMGSNYKDLVQQNVTQTLCNSHPKESGKVAI